jgi:cytochrome P450
MIGTVDTTSKCAVLVLQELIKRPEQLAIATTLAEQGDIKSLTKCCYEALRFNPHNPIVVRYAPAEKRVGKNGKYRIPAKSKIAVGIFSAMHDSQEFADPGVFNMHRGNEYLHFSYGMHACFGRFINAVQIPEIVASVLRLKNLRRSSLNKGKVIYDGPFPQAYWLAFDS